MSHKVHPKSFRIKGTEDWNIRGFYGKKMPQYLEEDFLIKDFLRKKLIEASVANIEIEHSANKLNIIIFNNVFDFIHWNLHRRHTRCVIGHFGTWLG